jgi:hypothetical protein
VRKAKKKVTQKEVSILGQALRSLGGLAGGAAGSIIGMPSGGASVGTSLGAALSKWLGSGDYSVSKNSLLNASSSIPMMHKDDQKVIIRHKEFVTEILSNTTFTVNQSLELNPGLSTTFPWLSKLAGRFQEYTIRGMVFHYIPTSGEVVSGTNPAIGSVMLQTSYRANSSAPGTKMELLNEYWATESKPSESFCHPIECDPKENPFNVQYVRSVDVPSGDSQLMYDLGKTFIATSGCPATGNVLGDLWVTYEIELRKPILHDDVVPSRDASYAYITSVSDTTNIFTGTVTQDTDNSFDCSYSGMTITFPKGVGQYLVTVVCDPSTTFSVFNWGSTAPTYTNCQAGNGVVIGQSYFRTTMGGSGGTLNRGVYQFTAKVTNATLTPSVTLVAPTITGTYADTTITVSRYQNSD